MGRRITTHPAAPCGCQATSWYAWSDDGMHDDGDTVVDECAWHYLQQAAFNTWLADRNRRMDNEPDREAAIAIQNEAFDEVHWMQVVEREDEWDTFVQEHAWKQAAEQSRWYTPLGVEPPF